MSEFKEISRTEPDDSRLLVLCREERFYGEPGPAEVEKTIKKFQAAKPPKGYRKVHDNIVAYHSPMTIVKVLSVYGWRGEKRAR